MTSSSTRNDIYSKLETTSQDIRILELLSAAGNNEPIRCNLEVVSLYDLPEFEALSYTWGEPDDDPQFQIWLNGALVRIRQNLWYALQRLRFIIRGPYTDRARRLWIDALCINQDDIEERNHQVAFMGHIYRHARVVLVWLGNEASNAKWRGSPSNSLNLDPIRPLSTFGEVSRRSDHIYVPFVATLLDSRYQFFWDDVAYICTLPYWQRLWIVQEICLASEVQLLYGNETCSWDDFWSIMASMDTTGHNAPQHPLTDKVNRVAHAIIHSSARRLALARGRTKSREASYDLWTWVTLCTQSECQDPRDKIYGLLSLANDNHEDEIEVDYSKSLFEVWEDVLQYYVNRKFSYASVVRPAEFFQNLLLSPLPGPETLLGMIVPNRSTSIKKSLRIQGEIRGKLQLSKVKPSNLSLFADGWVREKDQNKDYGKETRLIVLCWQSALRELWGCDHEIIAISPSRMATASHAIDEQLSEPLTLFHTQAQGDIAPGRYIGIGPGNCRDGDLLCCFQESRVAAILHFENGRYDVRGRALVSKWNSNITLGEPLEVQNSQDSRQQPHLDMDSRALQVLTCPLQLRSKIS